MFGSVHRRAKDRKLSTRHGERRGQRLAIPANRAIEGGFGRPPGSGDLSSEA